MELNRAKVIDENFLRRVKEGDFPDAKSTTTFQEAGLDREAAIDLFDSQVISRQCDLFARKLKESNQSFYTIGSSGHEGNAAVASVFRHTDMAFLHYRSGAFMVQRLKSQAGRDIIRELLLSLVAAADDPTSGGRHKVFGDKDTFVPPQTSTIASHLPKAVGAALSITRGKELEIETVMPDDSVVVCSFGDASLNHSAAQGALNTACWVASNQYPLPIVFVCEDNQIGISTPTPSGWVEASVKGRPGLHYRAADGLSLADTYAKTVEAVRIARQKHQPVFLHLKCVRLMGHAGSDIESQYLSAAQIAKAEGEDPLLHSARELVAAGFMTQPEVIAHYQSVAEAFAARTEEAASCPKLNSAEAVMAPLVPPKDTWRAPKPALTASQRKTGLGALVAEFDKPRNLSQQINLALHELLLQYPEAAVFGEDVGKKGGVYRVTAGLQHCFGQRRVFDTLLDETTILGTAIGMAHNGFIPIPEIQFLAYLHNAEDQLRGEAATLSFFSRGQFNNPMVLRIASLGYQKGFGGHFHNDNSIAVLRDLPGVIVACPARGDEAAMMLKTCLRLAYEQRRVVVFLEPIALYMAKDLHTPGDNGWLTTYPKNNETIDYGEVGVTGEGTELAIITYGNGYYFSLRAQKQLAETSGLKVKVINLRWLAPLPEQALLTALSGVSRVLIVDEGRRSGSVSEAIMTLLLERCESLPQISRLTGEDSFIPLGTSWQHVLPSVERIVVSGLAAMQAQKHTLSQD